MKIVKRGAEMGRRAALIIGTTLLSWPIAALAQDLEAQLRPLVTEIVAGTERAEARRITVADFADLQGQVTELGRFIAEELGTSLVMAKAKFGVVDRANLRTILAEHKLSMSGLVNPETAKKLGRIAGVDGIVTGTITPLGDSVRVSVKVIATESATIIAAARTEMAKTRAIEELLGRGVASGQQATGGGVATTSSGPLPSEGPAFQNKFVKMTMRSLRLVVDPKVRPSASLRLSMRIDNVTPEDLLVRCHGLRLIDQSGADWTAYRGEGLKLTYGPATQLSPGVPGIATIIFLSYDKGDSSSRVFDLAGQCEAMVRGQAMPFPVTLSGLRVSN